MAYESSRASDTLTSAPPLVFERLHTYFLFPFALDKEVIQANHPQAWPGKTPTDEIPIGHITNGVHFRSWISLEMNQLYDRYLVPS